MYEKNDAPRRQNTPHPVERQGLLLEPGLERSRRTVLLRDGTPPRGGVARRRRCHTLLPHGQGAGGQEEGGGGGRGGGRGDGERRKRRRKRRRRRSVVFLAGSPCVQTLKGQCGFIESHEAKAALALERDSPSLRRTSGLSTGVPRAKLGMEKWQMVREQRGRLSLDLVERLLVGSCGAQTELLLESADHSKVIEVSSNVEAKGEKPLQKKVSRCTCVARLTVR